MPRLDGGNSVMMSRARRNLSSAFWYVDRAASNSTRSLNDAFMAQTPHLVTTSGGDIVQEGRQESKDLFVRLSRCYSSTSTVLTSQMNWPPMNVDPELCTAMGLRLRAEAQ